MRIGKQFAVARLHRYVLSWNRLAGQQPPAQGIWQRFCDDDINELADTVGVGVEINPAHVLCTPAHLICALFRGSFNQDRLGRADHTPLEKVQWTG